MTPVEIGGALATADEVGAAVDVTGTDEGRCHAEADVVALAVAEGTADAVALAVALGSAVAVADADGGGGAELEDGVEPVLEGAPPVVLAPLEHATGRTTRNDSQVGASLVGLVMGGVIVRCGAKDRSFLRNGSPCVGLRRIVRRPMARHGSRHLAVLSDSDGKRPEKRNGQS